MTARRGAGSRERLSCSVELRRFGAWRAAIAVACMAALGASLAWAATSRDTVSPAVSVAVLAVAVGIVMLAASLARVESGSLRCDNGRWNWTPHASPSATETGSLAVALDLGSFMLLAFRPAGRPRRWLPAQRRGLEGDWQALRAAAHAPRPPAADAAGGRAA